MMLQGLAQILVYTVMEAVIIVLHVRVRASKRSAQYNGNKHESKGSGVSFLSILVLGQKRRVCGHVSEMYTCISRIFSRLCRQLGTLLLGTGWGEAPSKGGVCFHLEAFNFWYIATDFLFAPLFLSTEIYIHVSYKTQCLYQFWHWITRLFVTTRYK